MTATAELTAKQILSETGAPVIVFDHVKLAFDEQVVLADVSFTVIKGHTKIILGASGSGKSTAITATEPATTDTVVDLPTPCVPPVVRSPT